MDIPDNPKKNETLEETVERIPISWPGLHIERQDIGTKPVLILDTEEDLSEVIREIYRADFAIVRPFNPEPLGVATYRVVIDKNNDEIGIIIRKKDYEKAREKLVLREEKKLEKLLTKKGEGDEEERKVAECLTGGRYTFFTPIVAGLKPTGMLTEAIGKPESEQTMEQLKKWANELDIGCLKLWNYPGEGEDVLQEYVFYNPEAVKKTIQENPDIFGPLGINPTTNLEQAIRTIFTEKNFRYDAKSTEHVKALGILLGFDKQSVIDFNGNRESDRPAVSSIWGICYGVTDPEKNRDFLALQKRYDELFSRIEKYAQSDLKPSEILQMLRDDETVMSIRKRLEKHLD